MSRLQEIATLPLDVAKVAEPEGPLDTMSVVAEFPVRGLRTEAFGFLASEWWDAATARRACFLGKSSVMCASLL